MKKMSVEGGKCLSKTNLLLRLLGKAMEDIAAVDLAEIFRSSRGASEVLVDWRIVKCSLPFQEGHQEKS